MVQINSCLSSSLRWEYSATYCTEWSRCSKLGSPQILGNSVQPVRRYRCPKKRSIRRRLRRVVISTRDGFAVKKRQRQGGWEHGFDVAVLTRVLGGSHGRARQPLNELLVDFLLFYGRADRPIADVPANRKRKEKRREQRRSVKRAAVFSSQQGPLGSGPRTRVRAPTRVVPWCRTPLSGRRASIHRCWLLSSSPKKEVGFCASGRY